MMRGEAERRQEMMKKRERSHQSREKNGGKDEKDRLSKTSEDKSDANTSESNFPAASTVTEVQLSLNVWLQTQDSGLVPI